MGYETVNAYAGIGSRNTPDDILLLMRKLGKALALSGVMLRSGAAHGADSAFELGCHDAVPEGVASLDQLMAIYLPWEGFNQRSSAELGVYIGNDSQARTLASRYHPAWRYLDHRGRLLMARNGYQVLGDHFKYHVRFVLCWTPDGSLTGRERTSGGTGQALRIAKAYSVPVFNLYREEHQAKAEQWLSALDGCANSRSMQPSGINIQRSAS
ncbi:hypothetical protein IC617_08370 [Neiella sp. HB171785]|uniref:Uncharacterized protein n=1 Tax=Neiella litorisoli TaxID=2771431 RepID=A0A8J6QGD8_9GAMM|nr:hypothetical protein [Neiella litorisoli]MBD1389439.1 hypothetical protein [Neiella litorisoli]